MTATPAESGDFIDEVDLNYRVSMESLMKNKKLVRKSTTPLTLPKKCSSKASKTPTPPAGVSQEKVGSNYSEELYQADYDKRLKGKGGRRRNKSPAKLKKANISSHPLSERISKRFVKGPGLLILPGSDEPRREQKDDDLMSYNPFASDDEDEISGKLVLPNGSREVEPEDDLISYNPFQDSESEGGDPTEKELADGLRSMQVEKARALKAAKQQQRVSKSNNRNLTRALGTSKYNPFAYSMSESEHSQDDSAKIAHKKKQNEALKKRVGSGDPRLTKGLSGRGDFISGMFANFLKPEKKTKVSSLPTDLKTKVNNTRKKSPVGCFSMFGCCWRPKDPTLGASTNFLGDQAQNSFDAENAVVRTKFGSYHAIPGEERGIASFLELSEVEKGPEIKGTKVEQNKRKRKNFFNRMRASVDKSTAPPNNTHASSVMSGIPNKSRFGRLHSYFRGAVIETKDDSRNSVRTDLSPKTSQSSYCGVCNKRIFSREKTVQVEGEGSAMLRYHADCVKCDICKLTLGPEKVLEIRRDRGFLLCVDCSLNVIKVRKAHERMQEDTEDSTKYHRDLVPEGYLRFVKVMVSKPKENPVVGLIPMCSRCGAQLMVSDQEVMAEGAERYHKTCPPENMLKLRLSEDIRRVSLGFPPEIPVRINITGGSLKSPLTSVVFLKKDEEYLRQQRHYLIKNEDAPVQLNLVFQSSKRSQEVARVKLGNADWETLQYECEIREDVGPFIIGDRLAEKQFNKTSTQTFNLKGMFEHGFQYDVITNLSYDATSNSAAVVSVEFKCSLPKL